jgi:hypothetical protein
VGNIWIPPNVAEVAPTNEAEAHPILKEVMGL